MRDFLSRITADDLLAGVSLLGFIASMYVLAALFGG